MKGAIHGFTPLQQSPVPAQAKARIQHRALLADALAAGSVSYHGGPVLQNVKTRGVFLGDAWNTDPHAALRQQLDEFLTFLVTSDVIDNLAEYGTNGMSIGHGEHAGSVVLGQVAVGATLDDTAIQTALTAAIGDGTLAVNDSNTLYIAFTPDGTKVTTTSIGSSCDQMCGYHGVLPNGAPYAVIPYPGCSPCQINGSVFDGLTSVISHEVCEAVTNPFDNGWHADDDSEIGDLCAAPIWQTRQSGTFVVQKEFSQQNKDCR